MAQDYILGYGSLIDAESRKRTTPDVHTASPVIAKGFARGWWAPGKNVGFAPTYLGVKIEENAQLNGVIYPVSSAELEATDRREGLYERVVIPPEDLTMLDGSQDVPADSVIWIYALPADAAVPVPTADRPIVQSYVDICLTGCLDIEDQYPLAKDAGYANMFIEHTQDWNEFWVNDRLYPRRPFIFVPRCFQIDRMLHGFMPELFEQIYLEPRP